jgi:hypothetical protein
MDVTYVPGSTGPSRGGTRAFNATATTATADAQFSGSINPFYNVSKELSSIRAGNQTMLINEPKKYHNASIRDHLRNPAARRQGLLHQAIMVTGVPYAPMK